MNKHNESNAKVQLDLKIVRMDFGEYGESYLIKAGKTKTYIHIFGQIISTSTSFKSVN
jgi:hypothetical protein